MQLILDQIVSRCSAGERIALCTVVGSRGSTPQGKGAKMLVLGDGRTVGTLGGGCVEAEVRKQAIELITANQPKLLEFRLDHDYGWDDGLICGGIMDIYVQVLDASNVAVFESLARLLRENRPSTFQIDYQVEGGACRHYVEELGPPPTLVIAGAGHVGQALGALAATLDFRVTVIDDRADFASPERFPGAQKHIVGDIERSLRELPIDAATYIVIVTRGHRHDGHALAAVIESPAAYIGLIGSKAKIKTIFDDLADRGVAPALLERVRAPIGLEIGAITPNEIAVSIAAELIATRRGRGDQPAPPMKMNREQLKAWLERTRRATAAS